MDEKYSEETKIKIKILKNDKLHDQNNNNLHNKVKDRGTHLTSEILLSPNIHKTNDDIERSRILSRTV